MDEVVLKKMNKEEKTILEEELKKVCTEKKRGITAVCWGVEQFEKIRDLLDNGAELEKLEAFLKEKKLGADTYYHNGIPLAAHIYWYARGCGREDICSWAIETAVTLDGFLNVQEPEHQKQIAEKFTAWDEKEAYGTRKMFLHKEACWIDAPNFIAAILSGNVALVQAFAAAKRAEKKEDSVQNEKNKIVPVKNAKKLCYVLRRNDSMDYFLIPNLLTAVILSGSPEMLEYYIANYYEDFEWGMWNGEEMEALGKAIAGAGAEMSAHILKNHVELMDYVKMEQVLKAGNTQMLDYLLCTGKGEAIWNELLFMNTRDLTIPYASAPGFPRDIETDAEMYRTILDWKDPDFEMELLRSQIRKDILQPSYVNFPELHNEQEQEEKRSLHEGELFDGIYTGYGTKAAPGVNERKLALFKLYQELGGDMTPEVEKAIEDAAPKELPW